MSHPDPCYDPENSYEDDEMALPDDVNYDDYNDFTDEVGGDPEYFLSDDEDEEKDVWNDDYDDSMDGDWDSAMRDAGWGTDEDYGYYGEDY